MIIIKIYGGLGNQLFQYASAYSLSRRLNTRILFDINWYKKNNDHAGFQLAQVVRNKLYYVQESDLRKLFPRLLANNFNNPWTQRYLHNIGHRNFISEKRNSSLLFLNREHSYYLDGYWQSLDLFKDKFSEIRSNLDLAFEIDDKNIQIADRMKSDPSSVSVHVRRGDYVSEGSPHFVDLSRYYKLAFDHVKEIGASNFYVFTDDPAWARDNLPVPESAIFVDWNQGEACVFDMYLMGLAKHKIIANSTFSWWGAMLSMRKNGITIAPSAWFVGKNAPDIFPSDWFLI